MTSIRGTLKRRTLLHGLALALALPRLAWTQSTAAAPRAADDAELLAQLPALDPLQTGHIRHIENLAHQLDGEWAHMGIKRPYQEDFESLRYQIAYMAYALGLAHFNRLPAAPGYFRSSFDRLVRKMLLPDVWYYWRDASRGGGDAGSPAQEGWIDPVVKDNIMFSAYVQSMSAMYQFLFDDDKFTRPGALSFKFEPYIFRKDTSQTFVYDQNSLNDHIYRLMAENGHLGVACEPHLVFQICNQPAILGFRLQDILRGTDRAKQVTERYLAAWNEFGLLDAQGGYNTLVHTYQQKTVAPSQGIGGDGWLGALMHMWNPKFVEAQYPRQMNERVIRREDGTSTVPVSPTAGGAMDLAFCSMWASEVGDSDRVRQFLAYADRHLSPRWADGGYFYPRNDAEFDEQGAYVMVSPLSGNALFAYARLNVPNGLWNIYNKPWTREHFKEPLLTELSNNLDVTRAVYLPESKKLVFSVKRRGDRSGDARILVDNAWAKGRESWQLKRQSQQVAQSRGATLGSESLRAIRIGDALDIRFALEDSNDFVMSWS